MLFCSIVNVITQCDSIDLFEKNTFNVVSIPSNCHTTLPERAHLDKITLGPS